MPTPMRDRRQKPICRPVCNFIIGNVSILTHRYFHDYVDKAKPLRGSFRPVSKQDLRLKIFLEKGYLMVKSFCENRNFAFPHFSIYAMLCTVITMKNRKWILYPYSIIHASLSCGFSLICFIYNPASKNHKL